MSGRVGDLSHSQKQDLAQFKLALADVLKPKHDDYLLLQFLRARRFDLNKSEDMFRRHLQFREEFDEDYLVNEYKPPTLLAKYASTGSLGYAKDGTTLRVIQFGPGDVKGLLCCYRPSDMLKFFTWILDVDKAELKKRNEKTGVWVETRTWIYDMAGTSFKQIFHKDVTELLISFLKLYERNYPENLQRAFVINAPAFFAWLFTMIKPFLSEDTVKKIKIYGRSGWERELLEYVDADVLPVIYGGTRRGVNGDPFCYDLIPKGGMIPKEYYTKNQNRLNEDDEGVQKMVIGRRSREIIPIQVDEVGSTVFWEVDCKNSDIAFSLVYSSASEEIVLDSCKISNDYGVEKGCHLATKTGNYSLVLDNSFSVLQSKVICYKVFVSNDSAKDFQLYNDCDNYN